MISSDTEELYKLCERSIVKMNDAEAIEHIGNLIDTSFEASFIRGAKRALFLLDELSKRKLSNLDEVIIEYFRANAWNALSHYTQTRRSWAWESTERQEELLALSRASNHHCFSQLDKMRQCQILTNHANLLNLVGRSIDAIAIWDRALKILPNFAMALGNRGYGLKVYAGMIMDDRERAIIALHAYDSLLSANSEGAIYDSYNQGTTSVAFKIAAQELEYAVDIKAVRSIQNLNHGEKGQSKEELAYRNWCLTNRLFLSPLNDLGSYWAAAYDDIILPPILESVSDRSDGYLPPQIIGFYNQIKQEYVSARFTLFEGLNSTNIHYSDNNVTLTDTLNYPLYSLASERIRIAFRIAYSLLDKIAFLVNHYWALGKKPDKISFKNIWMIENKKRLLPQFESLDNLPLRGLFWLSKELFDERLKETTSADAYELHIIRNALEHTYLCVNKGWAKPFMLSKTNAKGFGITIGSDELEAKAIRVMKMVRSAILYVTFAINDEERKKKSKISKKLIGSMPLHYLEENRKRRDPL